MVAAAFSLAGCATASETPLIMSPAVSQDVRQAATCYMFNDRSDRYVFGVQADMKDYDEAAEFWLERFKRVEPDAAQRQRLIKSASEKMDTDFPRREVVSPNNGDRLEVYNASYGTIIASCESSRAHLENTNG